MMELHLFLFAIDVVAVLTIAIVGITFLTSQPDNLNARLWALIAFNSVCYLIFSRYIHSHLIPQPYQIDPGALLIPMRFAMNLSPGLLMVLTHSLFQDGKKFPRWLLAVFAFQVLLEEPIPLALSIDVALGDVLFERVPALLQLVFTALAMTWTLSDWRADMVEERRKLRMVLLLLAGFIVILSAGLGRVLIIPGIVPPLLIHVSSSFLCAVINIGVIFVALRRGTLFLRSPAEPPNHLRLKLGRVLFLIRM